MIMNKFTIPIILTATILVAGIFALMPVEQATTVHTTIQASQTVSKSDVDVTPASVTDAALASVTADEGGTITSILVDSVGDTTTVKVIRITIGADNFDINIRDQAVTAGNIALIPAVLETSLSGCSTTTSVICTAVTTVAIQGGSVLPFVIPPGATFTVVGTTGAVTAGSEITIIGTTESGGTFE